MKKLSMSSTLLVLLTSVVASNNLYAATVAATGPATVLEGATYTLSVDGSDFTTSTVGGDFTLTWDSDVLQFGSATVDATNWNLSTINDTDAGATPLGQLVIDVSEFAIPQTGRGPGFAIATIEFLAIGAAGTSTDLTLSAGNIAGKWTPLGNPAGEINVDYSGTTVLVTAVPVPPAILLFSSAIACIGWLRRRVTRAHAGR